MISMKCSTEKAPALDNPIRRLEKSHCETDAARQYRALRMNTSKTYLVHNMSIRCCSAKLPSLLTFL